MGFVFVKTLCIKLDFSHIVSVIFSIFRVLDKSMPGKRKIGVKAPIIKPNDAVSLLTDGEFADWMGLDGEKGKEFAYRRFGAWHRARCPHDPAEEKATFAAYNLYSLRKEFLKMLKNGMHELRIELPRELAALRDTLPTIEPSKLDLVLSLILELKQRAIHRGYFESLVKILEFEKEVVSRRYDGAKLKTEASRLKAETDQAKANLKLAAEIAYYRTNFLEAVRDGIYESGLTDQEKVLAYLATDFAKADVSRYPAILACAKLLIDEFFQKRIGDIRQACYLAEEIHAHNQKEMVLSPREHAMLLRRMIDSYSKLGKIGKATEVISYFEKIDIEHPSNRNIYLKSYLKSLFLVAFAAGQVSFGKKAIEIFERNEYVILDSDLDNDRLVLLIFVMTHYLGLHDGIKAKRIFDLLYKTKDQKQPLEYRIQYMISHLMILFEKKDYVQMQSFGKNYKEFFKERLPLTAPATAVLDFLRHHVRKPKDNEPTYPKAAALAVNRKKAFNIELDKLLAKLTAFESNEETKHSLMYGPYKSWLNSKRLVVVEVGLNPKSSKLHKKPQ